MHTRQGTSFIDLVVSIGILALLFGGIFAVYFSLLNSIHAIEVRTAAASLLQRQVEIVRNMPYDDVGTQGGVPAGVIPQQQSIKFGKYAFTLATTIRNIDDAFDGTLGGTPNDTAPADYKLLTMLVQCSSCERFVPLSFTTTIAPKNLESAGRNGSLFIRVLDANGAGISAASVHVVNASVTPSIDLADATNASGVLQLVGVPTSTQAYQIAVSKPGYSLEKTYPVGAPSNPNPVTPHATVAEQTVTNTTFLIDRVSDLTVRSSDVVCSPIGNVGFAVSGAKLIGTNPNVLKFSTSSATNASGTKLLAGIEWDTYTLLMTSLSYDVVGTVPFSPLVVNPSSSESFRFALQPANPSALLVTVVDGATGAGVADAAVTVSGIGYDAARMTGRATSTQTDWSGNNYASQDGGIEAEAVPGDLALKATASSTYPTSTTSWLISSTFDLGGASTTLYSLSWNPASQPPQTGSGSMAFQVAATNDLSAWNFVGPDGTANSVFTSSSSLPASLHGNRYVRYKVLMRTQDENTTPRLADVSLEFSGPCVPPYDVLFSGLAAGTYSLSAIASDYATATTTASLSSDFLHVRLELTRL